MTTFTVTRYRLLRRSGGAVRLIPGQSWTIRDDVTEYAHPIRREISRDLYDALFPHDAAEAEPPATAPYEEAPDPGAEGPDAQDTEEE